MQKKKKMMMKMQVEEKKERVQKKMRLVIVALKTKQGIAADPLKAVIELAIEKPEDRSQEGLGQSGAESGAARWEGWRGGWG